MKIYDISQEVFGCAVFPGDRCPRKLEDMRMSRGDLYNLTSLEMNVHNGTHIDAPFHFIADGDTVEAIPLEKTVGRCYVSIQNADIGREAAKDLLERASSADPACAKRILIKGKGIVTADAAGVFAESGVCLVGVESQTVGPADAPMEVHRILLRAKTVLLEGIRLAEVEEGAYFLNAAPISLMGSDGAPCRAILIRESRENETE